MSYDLVWIERAEFLQRCREVQGAPEPGTTQVEGAPEPGTTHLHIPCLWRSRDYTLPGIWYGNHIVLM